MSEQLALTEVPRTTRALEPMEMIQVAFNRAVADGGAAALAVAREILAQMEKQRDYEDRERFNAALRRIQDKVKPIAKRGFNNETKSWYALSDDVDNEIDALIRQEGMTLSFRPDVSPHPDSVLIIGVLSLGAYSREYPLDVPADGKGAKGGGVMTRTHATVSATTYGMRAIKKLIFNLRFKDKDDDGNKAGGKKVGVLDERAETVHLDYIKGANSAEELQSLYKAAQKDADAIGDTKATLAFVAAKNERYRKLKAEGKIQ
jgi:hypothetical protein